MFDDRDSPDMPSYQRSANTLHEQRVHYRDQRAGEDRVCWIDSSDNRSARSAEMELVPQLQGYVGFRNI